MQTALRGMRGRGTAEKGDTHIYAYVSVRFFRPATPVAGEQTAWLEQTLNAQKTSAVRAVVARKIKAGAVFRPEQLDERVNDRPAAVELDGEVVGVGLHGREKAGNAVHLRGALWQPRVAGEFAEVVQQVPKPLGKGGRPGEPDQCDSGFGPRRPQRPQSRHCTEKVAKLQRPQDGNATRLAGNDGAGCVDRDRQYSR
jgi:hypothetical protein